MGSPLVSATATLATKPAASNVKNFRTIFTSTTPYFLFTALANKIHRNKNTPTPNKTTAATTKNRPWNVLFHIFLIDQNNRSFYLQKILQPHGKFIKTRKIHNAKIQDRLEPGNRLRALSSRNMHKIHEFNDKYTTSIISNSPTPH